MFTNVPSKNLLRSANDISAIGDQSIPLMAEHFKSAPILSHKTMQQVKPKSARRERITLLCAGAALEAHSMHCAAVSAAAETRWL